MMGDTTVTMSYRDPATGKTVTTGPKSLDEIKRLTADVAAATFKRKRKPLTAEQIGAATAKKFPQEEAPMFSKDETGEAASRTVAAGQLRAFIERIERLEEEKKTIADDIKEIYAEARGTGYDTKAIRTIVRLRKQDQDERQEAEAIVDLYKAALGME